MLRAQEKERDERFYRQWLVQLPFMNEENYISFADYVDRLTGKNIDTRPAEVILAEIDEIEKEFTEKGGGEDGDGNI